MRNLRKNLIKKFIREKGGYFGVVGAISMTISAITSSILYSFMNPSFNVISYAVSDLATGPGLSGLIYSIGLLIASFSQIPLNISLINYLRKKMGNVFLIRLTVLSCLFTILSHNFLSIVPFYRTNIILYYAHGIAAGTHYVAGSFSLIFYGFIELSYVKVSKIFFILSFISGALYASLWIGYLLDFLVGIPEQLINHTIQWVALAGIILWSLLHGIFLIKTKKRDLVK